MTAARNVKPLVRLSAPREFYGQSLRKWRPLDPQLWRDLLSDVPGLSFSFSPADCVWQSIDYLRVLHGLVPAIEHVEANDLEINREILIEGGLFGPSWWRYRMPGKGQVDWRQLVEALKLYGYEGNLSLQFDDEFVNESDLESALDAGMSLLTPFIRG